MGTQLVQVNRVRHPWLAIPNNDSSHFCYHYLECNWHQASSWELKPRKLLFSLTLKMPPALESPALCCAAFVHLHEFAASWQLRSQRSQARNRHLSSFTLPYVLPTARGSEVKEHWVGHFTNTPPWFMAQAVFLHCRATGAVGDGDCRHVKFMHSCHSEDGGAAFKLWSQRLRSLKSDLYKRSATAWIKYPRSPWRLKFVFFGGGWEGWCILTGEELRRCFKAIPDDSQVLKITQGKMYRSQRSLCIIFLFV